MRDKDIYSLLGKMLATTIVFFLCILILCGTVGLFKLTF